MLFQVLVPVFKRSQQHAALASAIAGVSSGLNLAILHVANCKKIEGFIDIGASNNLVDPKLVQEFKLCVVGPQLILP